LLQKQERTRPLFNLSLALVDRWWIAGGSLVDRWWIAGGSLVDRWWIAGGSPCGVEMPEGINCLLLTASI